MEDLENKLKEAVIEYQKRIKANPDLGREFSETDTRTSLKGRNKFEVHAYLIKQMREAYINEDKGMLSKIPQYWDNHPGLNSVTFYSYDEYGPFNNETSGENIYWVTNTFKKLDSKGEKTGFSEYLSKKIKEYRNERNSIRDDILNSQSFAEAKAKIKNPTRKNKRGILMEIYRDEEFKRKASVIELCDKAEHIYELASRFFEELRQRDR